MKQNANGPQIEPFFHSPTGTWSYVVHDGHDAVIIDPVLDYDHRSGAVSDDSVKAVLAFLQDKGLRLGRILETHAHADHLSGAGLLGQCTGAAVGIGEGIRQVQAHFARVFGLPVDDPALAGAFAETYRDGDQIRVGQMVFEVLATPGHTADSLSYRIGRHVFVGDTLFAPDVGTARCDFPGGSAEALFHSIQRLHALPADTQLWLCHDYPPAGRQPRAWVSVAESRQENRMLSAHDSMADFIERRRQRDAALAAPNLLYPSLQVNIRGGQLPSANAQGQRYLLTPLQDRLQCQGKPML